MYLLYTDESGDPGCAGGSALFILSGLIIHEGRWRDCFNLTKQLRSTLRQEYDVVRTGELHANKDIAGRGVMWRKRQPIDQRIKLFQLVLETISQMPAAKTLSVCVNKAALLSAQQIDHSIHIHNIAWTFMLQRFHNFVIQQRGGNASDHGMVFHDMGHEVEIRKLMRKLRVYNYVPSHFGPSRNVPLNALVEDPVPRDSAHAQFLQMVDYIAYCVLRREIPVEKYLGLESVYEILRPVVLREASTTNDLGIIYYPKPGA